MQKNKFTNKKYIGVESGYLMDGIDDVLDFGNIPIVGDFTVSIFMKHISETAGETTVFGQHSEVLGAKGWRLGRLTGTMRFIVRDALGIGEVADFNLSAPLYGKWVHLVGVFKSAQYLRTYRNGAFIEEVPTSIITPSLTSNAVPLRTVIGGRWSDIQYTVFANAEVAHATIFNKELNVSEIGYIHRYFGIIPPTAHENVVFYQPLNINSFAKKSYFDATTTSIVTSVNQIGHGFSIGDCIYNNLGTWAIADGTNALLYSNPPTVITDVIDLNNFEYSQQGLATIANHGFILKNTLYCQSDGSLGYIETDNLIGKVVDFDTIHIASAIRQGIITSHSQFNYAKSSPLEEIIGTIGGKSDGEIGIPIYSTQDSFIELYDGNLFEPTTLGLEDKSGFPIIVSKLRFNNIDSATKSIEPNTTLPNITDDFSYLVNFSLPAEQIFVVNPTYGRFLTLKNTISGYSLEIRYNYITEELEFVAGLNELFMYSIERDKINNINLSAVVTRENGNIIFYLNGYPIVNTSTSLDLSGCDIIKIGN